MNSKDKIRQKKISTLFDVIDSSKLDGWPGSRNQAEFSALLPFFNYLVNWFWRSNFFKNMRWLSLFSVIALTLWDTINSLRFGDLIEVEWLDASESTGRFAGERHAGFDTPVRSVGYFLGLKGKRTKHVVIAKEIIDDAKAYHYNVIPVGMIDGITVLAKDRLDPETKRVLKKFAAVSLKKLRGKDGWAYAEGQNKKRVH